MIRLIWAALAIVSWAILVLLIEATMRIWPVGAAGTYARIISILQPRGVLAWLLLMGLGSAVINTAWFLGMKWTTATNTAMLFRLDLLFVVILGAALGIERITRLGMAVAPVMLLGLALLVEAQRLQFGQTFRGDMLIVLAALGLAGNAFVIRRIMSRMDAEAVATFNHVMSGLAFAGILLWEGLALPEAVRGDGTSMPWVWIGALGVANAVALPLYYAALRRMAVWKLRVFMLTGPVLVAVADWLIWGQTLHGWQWLGAILLLGGAGALARAEARKNPDTDGGAGEMIALQSPGATDPKKPSP